MQGKMNKHIAVRQHLEKYGTIESWQAIMQYGATRLSAIIYDLKHDKKNPMNIETIMVSGTDKYGNTSNYARYVYHRD